MPADNSKECLKKLSDANLGGALKDLRAILGKKCHWVVKGNLN